MPLNIAIIPARGGSKRLPDKNIKVLSGKPLINWTIEAALEYGGFDLVIVSTDSQKIADIALAAGALVPFLRPSELATDTSSTNDVITHVVNWVENNYDKVSRTTILQPTSPLRDASDIREAMELYDKKNAKVVVSVCELDHPIQYCNRIPETLSLKGFIPETVNKRSQDLERYYRLNGALYIISRAFIGSLNEIYCDDSYAFVMNKSKSIDIDDDFDFKIAEFYKKEALI